jgi:mannose-1-phosphate guanylyltransferase
MAIRRLEGIVPTDRILVVTGAHLVEKTSALGVLPRSQIIAEPAKRNTAGAIAWGMAHLESDAVVGIFPADHAIGNQGEFGRIVELAYLEASRSDALVTVGIRPDRPETGYGYIEVEADGEIRDARRFHEKPGTETAERYAASRHFLWNSGMFFWTASEFSRQLAAAAPDYEIALRQLRTFLGASEEAEAHAVFAGLPSISIDHLLLEKAARTRVIPGDFGWDDVGSLDALLRLGGSTEGRVVDLEGVDNLVVNRMEGGVVATLGVAGLVVVATPDAVLVCRRDRIQELRSLVEKLDESER